MLKAKARYNINIGNKETNMKTFNEFVTEEKQTFIIHGQAGGKFVTHELDAKSHDHAKKLFKKAMQDKGHKFSTTMSVRTKQEEEDFKTKSAASAKEREEKIAKNQAERDKDSEYWSSRQKEYDKQSYKGD